MVERSDIQARFRGAAYSLAAPVAVLLGTLALSSCSVPDYANPVEWYRAVVGDSDSEGPEVVTAPAPPGSEAAPGAGKRFPDIAAAPPGAKPEAAPAGREELQAYPVPGATAPFPKLATVPEPPPRETTLAELESVAEGLVADRENARYTDEVFRKEMAEEPPPPAAPFVAVAPPPPPPPRVAAVPPPPRVAAVPPPPPPPAPPPIPAAAPAVQPPIQPFAPVVATPAVAVRVTDLFRQHFSASGPYAVAPPTRAIQVALASGAYAPMPALTVAPGATFVAREPPGSAALYGRDPGATAFSSNSAVLHFGIGSAAISGRGHKALRAIAQAHRTRGGTIRVIGHASSRTRELPLERHNLVNFEVSLARAQAVTKHLTRLGVPAGVMFVSAKSDAEPVYQEWMPSGELGNRRVEVYIDF